MQHILVPAVGQYDNIGDIILRRPLLDKLRLYGTLHIYIGNAPKGYEDGLQLSADDLVYRSFSRWFFAGFKNALSSKINYVFKPGEIQLSIRGLKEHVAVLPLLVLCKLRKGSVLRIGTGSRNFSRAARLIFMPSVFLSDVSLWRDQETNDFVGRGSVVPDLAFSAQRMSGHEDFDRNLLVLSMRSDRPYFSARVLDGIRKFAARESLSICVITQVHRDDVRSRQLARDLHADVLGWDGEEHLDHEIALRGLYARASLVISDRLHVLIAAFTEGAVPVGFTTEGSSKIARHFQAAGVENVAVNSSSLSADEAQTELTLALGRREELCELLERARRRSGRVDDCLRAELAPSVAARSE